MATAEEEGMCVMGKEELEAIQRAKKASLLVGSDVSHLLDEQDELNVDWACQTAGEKLSLFNEAMKLFVEVIVLDERYLHQKDEHIAYAVLSAGAFNNLRAACVLLLRGYYRQIQPLLRGAEEISALTYHFYKSTGDATLWLKGKNHQRILKNALREHTSWGFTFGKLSEVTHETIKAMAMQAYDGTREEVTHVVIGGHQNERLLHEQFNSLIRLATLVLAVFSKPYQDELDAEWHNRFGRLRSNVGRIAP